MGHCSLGWSVPFAGLLGWETLTWVRVSPEIVLLGSNTIAWARPVCRKTMDSVDSLDFNHGLSGQSGQCPWTPWTKSSESMDKVQ